MMFRRTLRLSTPLVRSGVRTFTHNTNNNTKRALKSVNAHKFLTSVGAGVCGFGGGLVGAAIPFMQVEGDLPDDVSKALTELQHLSNGERAVCSVILGSVGVMLGGVGGAVCTAFSPWTIGVSMVVYAFG
jgi:hypothetical protein